MEAVTAETAEPPGVDAAGTPGPVAGAAADRARAQFARMRIETDRTRALVDDTLTALEPKRPDAHAARPGGQSGGGRSALPSHRPGDEGVRRRGLPQGARASSGASATRARPESWRRRPTRCSISSAARLLRAAAARRVCPMTACCSAPSPTTPRSSPSGRASAHWFAQQGLPFDYVLYSQLRAPGGGPARRAHRRGLELAARLGARPAAGRRARRHGVRPLAMRDTDRDLTSVDRRARRQPDRPSRTCAARRSAMGAVDSPQATLLPLAHLRDGRACEPGGTSRSAASTSAWACTATTSAASATPRARWLSGEVDAACMIDGNHLLFAARERCPPAHARHRPDGAASTTAL